MNTFAKVLVVFILLLSAAFAISQMMVYAKREKYRVMYEQADKNYRGEQQKAKNFETLAKDRGAQLDTVRNDYNREKDAHTADLGRDKLALEDVKLEKNKLDTKLTEQLGNVTRLATLVDDITKARQAAEDKNVVLTQDKQTLQAQVAELEKTGRAKDDEIKQLAENMKKLEEEKLAIAKQRDHFENTLASLRARGIQVPEEGFVEAVDASVAQVDNTFGSVVLDKGSKSGIKANWPFTIYREGQFVAKVRVIEVLEDYCLGRVEKGMFAQPMKIGDNATTRLQ